VNGPRTTLNQLRSLASAVLLGLIVCLVCSATEAQAPLGAAAEDPLAYTQAIDRAVAAYDAGEYGEARGHFAAAHAISPNARTLRGLGKTEFELRNYGQSLEYLEASLASEHKPLDDRLRDEVSALVQRARAYVGELHVQVEPGTATVSIDGVKVASGPEASLSLVIGDHILEFHALGRVPEKREVKIAAGERTSVRVALAMPTAAGEPGVGEVPATAPAAALHPNEDQRDQPGTPLRRRAWLWTAVGVVAAGAAVGLVFALTGDSREREGEPVTTPNTPPGSTIQTLGAR